MDHLRLTIDGVREMGAYHVRARVVGHVSRYVPLRAAKEVLAKSFDGMQAQRISPANEDSVKRAIGKVATNGEPSRALNSGPLVHDSERPSSRAALWRSA
jgi:hypothetical protein